MACVGGFVAAEKEVCTIECTFMSAEDQWSAK